MINVVIVEDNLEALNVLKQIITDFYSDIKIVSTFSNVKEAYGYIKSNQFDILIIDIELEGELNGIELLNLFEGKETFKTIIYSGKEDFAIEALRLNAFDFLTKPLSLTDLNNAIKRFKSQKLNDSSLEKKDSVIEKETIIEDTIKINTHDKFVFINPLDIMYLQALGAYTVIFYGDGLSVKTSKNVSHYYKLLNNDNFIRISRSLVINKKQIKEIKKLNNEEYLLNFKGNIKLALSQRIKKQLIDLLKI